MDPHGSTTGGVQDVHFKAAVMREAQETGQWIAHWMWESDRTAPLNSLRARLGNASLHHRRGPKQGHCTI